ncbi:MAG: SDR family oxidoreductase [Eubacterium sp.]|nr:SDR family oxidoreductase [Eubacterium sp.]
MKKNILITGASRGIGKATAEYLARENYNLILVARNESSLLNLAENLGQDITVFPYDLSDLEHISQIFEHLAQKGIKLDGLVHCAGVNNDIPIRNNNIDLMRETLTINYMSFVELVKYFSKKKYSNDGASIVAISSLATNFFSAGMSTYTSSKAALEATIKIAAKEFIKRKIRVNGIAPNCVDTEMVENAPFLTDEKISRSQGLGIIEPIHIAYLAEFLMSDKSNYITGAIIPVSAGTV